jgi:uncharacterized protein YggU (UPF0235/DUF167 family)
VDGGGIKKEIEINQGLLDRNKELLIKLNEKEIQIIELTDK